MEALALISFFVLFIAWMALPATQPVASESARPLGAKPVGMSA